MNRRSFISGLAALFVAPKLIGREAEKEEPQPPQPRPRGGIRISRELMEDMNRDFIESVNWTRTILDP